MQEDAPIKINVDVPEAPPLFLHFSSTSLLSILRIAFPVDLSALLWVGSQSLTVVFVSQSLGSHALAEVSVGMTVFNLCGMSIVSGLGSVLDTLVPQAFGRGRLQSSSDPATPPCDVVLEENEEVHVELTDMDSLVPGAANVGVCPNPLPSVSKRGCITSGKEIGQILQRSIVINLVVSLPFLLFFCVSEVPLTIVFGQWGVVVPSVVHSVLCGYCDQRVHSTSSSWAERPPLGCVDQSICVTLCYSSQLFTHPIGNLRSCPNLVCNFGCRVCCVHLALYLPPGCHCAASTVARLGSDHRLVCDQEVCVARLPVDGGNVRGVVGLRCAPGVRSEVQRRGCCGVQHLLNPHEPLLCIFAWVERRLFSNGWNSARGRKKR